MPEVHDTRLRALEVQTAEILTLLRGLAKKIEDRIEASDVWRKQVDSILKGDGNGNKGHNVRLDRLEQAAERNKWMVRSLFLPVLFLAVKAGIELLSR